MNDVMNVYDFSVRRINHEPESLEIYRGNVLLIVNTASKCGFTKQFAGLQSLYETYHDQGLNVLGFPCNQFRQELGNSEEIQSFCTMNYNVTFPMYEQVNVNGQDAHPLYKYLTNAARGIFWTKRVKWNFTKFLVNRDGKVVRRYGSKDEPAKIANDVIALL